MICNALTCFTDPLSARSAPTQERSSLPLVEKASRGAAAKIPPPPGGIVSSGLSGSPPCTIGTLSDKCAILSDESDESDESDGAEYRPAAPSQLPLTTPPPGSPAQHQQLVSHPVSHPGSLASSLPI